MNGERTSVGLDVHARSVVACGVDHDTGEMFRSRLSPQPEAILAWLQKLPGPVAATYEAGPTGYGLARFLSEHYVRSVVPSLRTCSAGAVPSRVHRCPGTAEGRGPRASALSVSELHGAGPRALLPSQPID